MITKATKLRDVLKNQECKKCGSCCKFGTGFLADGDLKQIARVLHMKEDHMKEEDVKKKYLEEVEIFNKKMLRPRTQGKPYGECVFLKGNLCSIHPVKPLQCKIGNCSSDELVAWFLLNYVIDEKDPEAVRQYRIYLESGGKEIPGGRLQDLVPDSNELKKILSFERLR
ncbi:YkgJ family cysteine cluster protein [Candidatus Woesearchaeota archaeon]|nr:YkgJ family cysteine cluster protein [Candidatus Woesearchaeota archaeon]